MTIGLFTTWMWGMRRLDTRLAIDLGKFTLYIWGFSYRNIIATEPLVEE